MSELSDDENRQIRLGLCTWQIETGMPWITYCQERATDGTLCAEHARDCRELYGKTAKDK